MCSASDKAKPEPKVCELCNKVAAASGDRVHGMWLRGINLCLTCERELGGGKFSAPIVQGELKSIKVGGLFADRSPLPRRMLEAIWGNQDERNLAAVQRQPATSSYPVYVPVPRRPWRLENAATGDFVRDASGVAKQFNTAEQAIKAALPRPRPRKAKPVPPVVVPVVAPMVAAAVVAVDFPDEPQPADDWRQMARRISLAAFV